MASGRFLCSGLKPRFPEEIFGISGPRIQDRVADVKKKVFDDVIEDVLARGVIGDDADGCLCAWCGRGCNY